MYPIHRLVAIAFIDNPENKSQVNHIDGNKLNNNVSNLEWATASENVQHAFDTGLKVAKPIQFFGETNPHCKLTDEQCEEIRKMKKDGYSTICLSELFNIGKTQIYRIVNGEQRKKGSVCVG